MTTIFEIILVSVAVLFIAAFFLGVYGMLTSDAPSYMPMSPDEEYQMLTEQYGLTDEEAADIMRPRSGI